MSDRSGRSERSIQIVRDERSPTGWGLLVHDGWDGLMGNTLLTSFPPNSKVKWFKVLGNYHVMGGQLHNYRPKNNRTYSIMIWSKTAKVRWIVQVLFETPDGDQLWTYIGKPVMYPGTNHSSYAFILDDHFSLSMSEPNFLDSGYPATIYISSTYPDKYVMTILSKHPDMNVYEDLVKRYDRNGFKILGLEPSRYVRSSLSQSYPLLHIPGYEPYIEHEPGLLDGIFESVKNPW